MVGRTFAAVSVISVILVSIGGVVPSADASFPGANGVIAYSIVEWGESDDFEGTFINDAWVSLIPSKGRHWGSQVAGGATGPAFSADGRFLAFADAGGEGLRFRRLRGRHVRKLTKGNDQSPAWSPDGRRLAYSRLHCVNVDESVDQICKSRGLYTIKRDGRWRRLVARQGLEPAWSIRGELAFVSSGASDRLGRSSGPVRVADRGGKPIRTLTRRGAAPDWSPLGDRISYLRGNSVFVVNRDGSGARRLFRQRGGISDAVWSPDGRSIALATDSGILIKSVYGGKPRRPYRDAVDTLSWRPTFPWPGRG